jgi:hypothetical protein
VTANPEIPQQYAPYRDTGQAPVDWRPIPDPTRLTTEQLRRELATLREILETRLDAMDRATELATAQAVVIGQQVEQTRDRLREETAADVRQLRELLETRLDGMDRAIRLHAEIIDRVPAERDTAIKHLEELHDEKFGSIALQFAERDVRSEQATEGAKQALDAALLAQKELVAQQNEANSAATAKAEASFTKQIDQIGTIIQTLEKALDARITELKERIDRGEGSTAGAAGSRSERRLDAGQVLTARGVSGWSGWRSRTSRCRRA